MTISPRPQRLTSDEVSLVLHRVADIEAAERPTGTVDGYEAAAVVEAAREVGLSPAAVHQAVAELRAGALTPEPPPGAPARRSPSRGAASRQVVQQRLVDVRPTQVQATIDGFMRTQMFELRRRSGDRSLYRQRSDLLAHVRRRLDFGGAIKLDGLSSIDVVVAPADDDRTLVRVQADLVASRTNALAGGAAVGAAVTMFTGLTGALFQEAGLIFAALPAGVLVGSGSMRVAGGRWQHRRDDVAEVLASLLDRL